MHTKTMPRFPRGFILSLKEINMPPGFIPGTFLPNFYVHPWLDVMAAEANGRFVIILGECVPTSEDPSSPAEVLLDRLAKGQNSFFEELGKYGGRYVVLFGEEGDIRVVNDATAMRSVFYSAEGGVVSSHAVLVESALGGDISRDDLVFAYGYPGNRTPFSRTKLLTANTWLSMSEGSVNRFWPTIAPPRRTVDDVAAEILNAASASMRHIAEERTVRVALTAGIDSRAVMAVALNAEVEFETYTYGSGMNTALDRAFASDFARYVGVPHSIVPRGKTPGELKSHLAEAHYSPHHQPEVIGLMGFFSAPRSLAVSGNLLEIGRSFYKNYAGQEPPVSPDAMASLHLRSMSKNVKQKIESYGQGRFLAQASSAFRTFIIDTGYLESAGLLDPFDQFYWEHRMSAWHGPAMVERDFYATAFIPFNARVIFEAMLGVSITERKRAEVFYRLIEMVNPRLLDYPINPARWPLEP